MASHAAQPQLGGIAAWLERVEPVTIATWDGAPGLDLAAANGWTEVTTIGATAWWLDETRLLACEHTVDAATGQTGPTQTRWTRRRTLEHLTRAADCGLRCDAAVLQMARGGAGRTRARLRESTPSAGTMGWIVGFGLETHSAQYNPNADIWQLGRTGASPRVWPVTVSDCRTGPNPHPNPTLQLVGRAAPGMSGAPIVDAEGWVLGMVTGETQYETGGHGGESRTYHMVTAVPADQLLVLAERTEPQKEQRA